MNKEIPTNIILRKELFITNKQQDIRKYYQFYQKPLGRGTFGVVYKAKMINSPYTERAVKIIPKMFLKNPESLINEANILKKLDHPNIIKLYETYEDKEHYYLVLDYCEGGQLFGKLSNHGKFNQVDARQIFSQIIKILKYLNKEKIAHRDLKPENFLMFSNDSFQIKLIDFGLSYQYEKDMKQQLKSNNINRLLGTAYYIAPEVIKLNYDQRCDIWSAGVILYILATATPPFDGSNNSEILQNVAKLQYSLESPEARLLSLQLKDLIKKILMPENFRLSIDEILNHSWMIHQNLSLIPLRLNFKKLKQFCNFSKLKKIAVTYIASQLPQKYIHKLGDMFKQIDSNNDGYLTVEQLNSFLDKQKQNPSLTQLNKIIDSIDTDRNGQINYNQFIACCLESSIIQNQIYLEYVFKSFDLDNNGTISKKQFKEILENSNYSNQILGSFIDEIMKECDKDNDGEINYRQFLQHIGYRKKNETPLLNSLNSPHLSASRSPSHNSVKNISHNEVQSPYESPLHSPCGSPYI